METKASCRKEGRNRENFWGVGVGSINTPKIIFTKNHSQKNPFTKWESKKNFSKKSDYKKLILYLHNKLNL